MDKSSASVSSAEDKINRHKSLTPAILGIPSGQHGAKLLSSMNLKDKKDLLEQLEAWRQARKEKLTATILAKGKQLNTSKPLSNLAKQKVRTTSNPPMAADAKQNPCDRKKNVFDRLYESASKPAAKKPEEPKNDKLNVPCVKPSKYPPFKKPKKPIVILITPPNESSDPTDKTSAENSSSVPGMEQGSEKDSNIYTDCKITTFDKQTHDIGNHSKEALEDSAEPEYHSNYSEEEGHERKLSVVEEEELEDGVSTISESGGSNLEEASHELFTPDHVEEGITENPDEVEAEADEFQKDDGAVNFNTKDSVCFETPREKILTSVHLRNELEDWLTENGHSIDSYRHLRCFDSNGEKTPMSCYRQAKMDGLSNSSFYSTAPNTPVSEIIDECDKENVAPLSSEPKIDIKDVEGLLGDLHRLIVHVEYPSDRCEEWLNAITKKFPNCKQLPMYWECLAAINGNDNGLKSADDNEESEKKMGDEHETSVTELFEKLGIDEKCHSASKTERGLSMKNIFKSKTVKFAVQEKAVKEVNPELGMEARRKVLVVTPVRRSARLQTPDKSNVINSLQNLDPETRRAVSFQPNEALLND